MARMAPAFALASALVAILSIIVVHGRPTSPEEVVLPFIAASAGARQEPYGDLDKPVLQVGDVEYPLHRNAVRDRAKRWKDGMVPFVLDQTYPDAARATILEALQEIESDAASNGTKCIQFIPRTNETSYLKIARGTGCHSPIGYDPEPDGTVTSTLGPGCEIKGVAMHEILHVLGFFHEQNRPDRDLYVDINETNVANMRDFFIRNDTVIDTLGAPYDFQSIMHYGAYNSGNDNRYPVTTPKPAYAHGRGRRLGQRIRLSDIDVMKLQTLYSCPVDTGHIHSDMDDQLVDSCDFGSGMCRFQPAEAANGDAVKWVVRDEPTLDGPVAGFTNGLDPFLYASLENPTGDSSLTSSGATNDITDGYTNDITDGYTNEITDGYTNEITDGYTNDITDGYTNDITDGYTNDITDGYTNDVTDGYTDDITDGYTDDITDGYTNDAPTADPVTTEETTPATPQTATIYTPLFTSSDDGAMCVEFFIYQARTSYIDLYLSGPGIQRQLLRSYSYTHLNRWGLDAVYFNLGGRRQFRLEFVANLLEGSVSLDDFFLMKGNKCVFFA